MPEGAEDRKLYIMISPSELLLDGERPQSYVYIRAKDVQPYAEVTGGSLASGNLTVKMTVPYVDQITNLDKNYYYAILKYDDTELAKKPGTELTVEGNTISATFDAFTAPKDNLMRCHVKVENYMLDFDGSSNTTMTVPFKGYTECGHANTTSFAAKEPTTEEPGYQAYDLCEDCGKFFLAGDSQHEKPVRWTAIEIEKICTHEGFWGEDDICSHCGAIREHADRTRKTWTMGGITVTYNPRDLSLTFSGNGYLPTLNYSLVVDGDYAGACREYYPWYKELELTQTLTSYGTQTYTHKPLNTVIIEDGVKANGYDDAIFYLNVPVVIIRATGTGAFGVWASTLTIVEDESAKDLYPYSSVYTKAEAEALGYTTFPQLSLQSDCFHRVKYAKVPPCNGGKKNTAYEYCPVCGLYFYTEKYTYSINLPGHNFNSAGKCTECGKYDASYCHHEQTTMYEAVEATEEHPGHIAFQKCNGCDQYFAATDASHTRPLNFNRDVLISLSGNLDCEHDSYTDGLCDNCGLPCPHGQATKMRPECIAVGEEYIYECDKCHLHFLDRSCSIPLDEHMLKHDFGPDGMAPFCSNCNLMNPMICDHPIYMRFELSGEEPTCLTTGSRSCYTCQQCGALFESYESMEPITRQDLFLPVGDHHYHPNGVCMDCGAEMPGASYCAHNSSFYGKTLIGDDRQHCTDPEGIVYYQCNSCYRYFYYPDPANPSSVVNVTKPQIHIADGRQLHGGSLSQLYSTSATCTEDGYNGHKHCDACGRNYPFFYEDAECTIANAISDEDFERDYVWEKAHHDYNKKKLSDTPDEDGFYNYVCDHCSEGRNDYKILPGFNTDGTDLVLSPKRTGGYSATSLKLDDIREGQFCPLDFDISTATYTREVGEDEMWGIICLPFGFTTSEVTGNFKFYTLESIMNSGTIQIYKMRGVNTFYAGEPAVFCKTVDGAETLDIKAKSKQTNWNSPLQVSFTRNGLNFAPYLKLSGTITGTTIKSDADVKRLHLSGKQELVPAPEDKGVAIPAFRGWFEHTGHPQNTAFFLLDEYDTVDRILTVGEDGNLQECNDIYDLSGRKLTHPVKGQVNIVNGKKLFIEQ